MAPLKSEARERASKGRPARRSAALTTLAGLIGALATALAILVGTVLAVIFAATLACVMVLASVLLALAALAWRAQPRAVGVLAKGRHGGHAWIAYDWDGARR